MNQLTVTFQKSAGVVKLADTPDLGSDGESHGGSSPSARTNVYTSQFQIRL